MSATLHSGRRHEGLAEAVRAARMDGAVALISAPTAFAVAWVAGGRLADDSGELDVSDVFEARCFAPVGELRWVRRGESGTAVLLSEDPAVVAGFGGETLAPLAAVETFDQQYLLWGATTGDLSGSGWCDVQERRIGRLRVPFEAAGARGRRLCIEATEYVCIDAEHGNAYVADERLRVIAWASGIRGADADEVAGG